MILARAISFDEQRQNVVQLSRDRKNEVGGYAAGIKDFAEMGPPSGEHWPLSAEQIKRAFGVAESKDDPASEYVLLLRAESHAALEQKAKELREHTPELWRAWDAIFDPDGSGDRDYEWYAAQSAKLAEQAESEWKRRDELEEQEKELIREGKSTEARKCRQKAAEARRDALVAANRSLDYGRIVFRCDRFVDLLTLGLMDSELLAEFSTRMTRLEEETMEKQNAEILDVYQDLQSRKSKAEAKRLVCRDYGISERTLARIEEGARLEAGLPKRPKGRPPKEDPS